MKLGDCGERLTELESRLAYLEAARPRSAKATAWIALEDQEPPAGVQVIVMAPRRYFPSEESAAARFDELRLQYVPTYFVATWPSPGWCGGQPTHWFRIPEPPELPGPKPVNPRVPDDGKGYRPCPAKEPAE